MKSSLLLFCYFCCLFRLNFVIVRPAIIYGVADRQGLSKLLHVKVTLINYYE